MHAAVTVHMSAPPQQVWDLLRTRRNIRDMTTTLNRIKGEVEG